MNASKGYYWQPSGGGYAPDYAHIYYYNPAGQVVADPGVGNLITIPNMVAGVINGIAVIAAGAPDTRLVLARSGIYQIIGQFSCADGVPNFLTGIAISVNGVEVQEIHSSMQMDNSAVMIKTGSCAGLLDLDSADVIRLCWKNEGGAGNNQVYYAQLSMLQITGLD